MSERARLAAQALAVALVAGLLALLVWKVATDGDSDVADALQRGETPLAPDFTLPRLDREGELSLRSLRGKAVVLNFWASWCEPCKEEAPVLEQAWRRHRGRGVIVLGIDVQDLSSDARRFARKYGMTYPLVRDGRAETENAYAVAAVPETLFVDRKGKLVPRRIEGAITEEQLEQGIELALG